MCLFFRGIGFNMNYFIRSHWILLNCKIISLSSSMFPTFILDQSAASQSYPSIRHIPVTFSTWSNQREWERGGKKRASVFSSWLHRNHSSRKGGLGLTHLFSHHQGEEIVQRKKSHPLVVSLRFSCAWVCSRVCMCKFANPYFGILC